MSQTDDLIRQTLFMTAQERRAQLSQQLFDQARGRVLSGPFAGMILPRQASWGDGDRGPKLLGCYEAELHPVIEAWRSDAFSAIVNIGCAEGYYAVGLARLFPTLPVFAFDIDANAQAVCREAGVENGVSDRLSVAGRCDPATLQTLLADEVHPLLVVDCEGYELDLIVPAEIAALARCSLIIEVHDFIDRSIGKTLLNRLTPTHELAAIMEGGRNPNAFPALHGLPNLERWLMVDEGRPETMSWIIARPRGL